MLAYRQETHDSEKSTAVVDAMPQSEAEGVGDLIPTA